MHYKTNYSSPVGEITIASDGENIIGLWIEGQKYFAGTLEETAAQRHNLPVFHMAEDWLNRYFSCQKPSAYELPLAPEGSQFRQKVWQILCEIPYGQVISYGDIAHMMGNGKGFAHAVGGAVSHNPISVIIPCHRVVGSDGSLTGYAGGIDKKIKLLELEGVDMRRLYIPQKGTAL